MRFRRYILPAGFVITLAALLSGCNGKINVPDMIDAACKADPRLCAPKPEPAPIPTPTPSPTPDPVPTPTPPTSAGGFPQGLPEAAFTLVSNSQPATSEIVTKAMRVVVPCQDGHCIAGGPQKFMKAVVEAIRAAGTPAGQHADGVSDEIAVQRPDGAWDAWHIYNGDDRNKPETQGTAWFPPGSYKGAWLVNVGSPAEAPTYVSCPLPLDFDGETRFPRLTVEPITGLAQQYTVKTEWCSKRADDPRKPGIGPAGQPISAIAPEDWDHACGTQCCRVGQHEGDDGIACEKAIFGAILWSWSGGVRPGLVTNPYNFKVAGVDGDGQWIKACGIEGRCSASMEVK